MIHTIIETSTPSTINWSVRELIRIANQYNHVVDVGCGDGKTLKRITSKDRRGFDACQRAITAALRNNNGANFFCVDLTKNPYQTIPDCNCLYGIDILEHFQKDIAICFLKMCEMKASNCLIWFIPVGNHPQTKDDRGFDNDYYQTHRSTWHPEDMEKLGYEVWHYPNWHKNMKPPKEKGAMWCLKVK